MCLCFVIGFNPQVAASTTTPTTTTTTLRGISFLSCGAMFQNGVLIYPCNSDDLVVEVLLVKEAMLAISQSNSIQFSFSPLIPFYMLLLLNVRHELQLLISKM